MNNKIHILHISYDLRDRLGREKTTAVKNLISVTSEFAINLIIDLVRVPNISEEKLEFIKQDHIIINSFGLPFGFFLVQAQKRVIKRILNLTSFEKIDLKTIDIIHAHKLTFEGIIGFEICKRFNIPLMVTLRQTDTMILNRKPYLKHLYKEILQYCKVVYFLNPYTKVLIRKKLGDKFYDSILKEKMKLLPNIVERNITFKEEQSLNTGIKLLTVMRMTQESIKRKNLKKLLKAMSLIEQREIKLEIIGDGDYLSMVKNWVRKYKIEHKVRFLGKINNDEIDFYYRNSMAFILPSFSETFGMVYAEALQNHTPILYSKDCLGFDGYFDNVGVGVNPNSVNSIKDGILELIEKNDFYKKNIKKLSMNGDFKIFSSNYIRAVYSKNLKNLVIKFES